MKENASRMELVMTTLVLHKCTDGFDTRIAETEIWAPFVQSPLAQRLGVVEAGCYIRAPGGWGIQWDFQKVTDL